MLLIKNLFVAHEKTVECTWKIVIMGSNSLFNTVEYIFSVVEYVFAYAEYLFADGE